MIPPDIGSERLKTMTGPTTETLNKTLAEPQDALAACEARFRGILNGSADSVLIVDHEGIVRFANSAAETLLDRSAESLQSTTFGFPTIAGEMTEIDLVQGDHQLRVAEMRMTEMEWEGENAYAVLLYDVTERKQAAKRLRKSEARYRLLAENTVDVIWLMDMELTFTYVNPAIETMTGFTPKEWIGSTLRDHCDAENFAQMQTVAQEALARLPATNGIVFETTMLKKNGEPIPVEITGRVLLDESGEPVGLQGVTRDITERKRAEEQIAKLAKFPAENPNPVLRVTRDGRVMYTNPPGETLLDVWGSRESKLLPDEWRQLVVEALDMETQQIAEMANNESALSLAFAPVAEEAYVNIYGLDITERKRNEMQLSQYATRLETLHEIDQAILEARSTEEIAVAALKGLKTLIACQAISVLMFDFETAQAEPLFVHFSQMQMLEAGPIPLTQIRPLETLQQGDVHVIDDLAALQEPTPAERVLLARRVRSHLSVPLMTHGGLTGSLNLAAAEPGAFTKTEIAIAREVADQLAIALEQSRLHEQAQRHAKELEQRVEERTVELQRLVKLMAGRELRMAELKDVIRLLRKQLKDTGLTPAANDPLLGEDV
jgi:PAS domain S-box-containing protein